MLQNTNIYATKIEIKNVTEYKYFRPKKGNTNVGE